MANNLTLSVVVKEVFTAWYCTPILFQNLCIQKNLYFSALFSSIVKVKVTSFRLIPNSNVQTFKLAEEY